MHTPPTGVSHWQLKLRVTLTIDILCITANFGRSFDILIFDFLLKPPQPATRLFYVSLYHVCYTFEMS